MPRPDRRERRRARAAKLDGDRSDPTGAVRGHDDTSTPLHEQRLDAVIGVLLGSDVRSVVDLGCGSGALLRRLAQAERFSRIAGVDTSLTALRLAERLLRAENRWSPGRIGLHHGSLTAADARWAGFDAATLVETIEHIEPHQLSEVETAVFGRMRPAVAVLTTPNRDYNVRYGIAEDALRHADHRFEWGRARLQLWATGVAGRNGYRVCFTDIGDGDPLLGAPTQMAFFLREGDHLRSGRDGAENDDAAGIPRSSGMVSPHTRCPSADERFR